VRDELDQPVVAIDHAAIEVVEIGGREASAVERHQRAQVRRNDRHDVQNHPFGLVPRVARVTGVPEGVDDLEALQHLLLAML
jgi:hypothetical protein